MSSGDLKQLAAVPRAVDSAVKYGEGMLQFANEKLPASVKPTVTGLEQKISTTVAPVISTLADKSDKLLHVVDNQVDAAVKTASTVIENQRQFHVQNLEQYKAAREAYLKKIEALVEFLKEKGLSGTAQYLLDGVKAQLARVKALPDAAAAAAKGALESLQAAYGKLVEHPQVKALLDRARPYGEWAWGKYMGVHDAVVANGLYRFSYDKAAALVGYAQSTSLFKFAQARVYQPFVSPYADPAFDKLVKAGYLQALLDHVKPSV